MSSVSVFNATATTDIYTLSLHDALPIFRAGPDPGRQPGPRRVRRHLHGAGGAHHGPGADRKSTRLNSSHVKISYAVFCLKKKTRKDHRGRPRKARAARVPVLRGGEEGVR